MLQLSHFPLIFAIIFFSPLGEACELKKDGDFYTYSTSETARTGGDAYHIRNIFKLDHKYRCIKQANGRILLRHGAGFKSESWVSVNAFNSIQYYNPYADALIMEDDPDLQRKEDELATGELVPTGTLNFAPPTCDCKRFGHSCYFSNTPYSRFGTRPNRIAGGRSSLHHKGCDIAGPAGGAVVAVERGKVTFAARNGGYGNAVWIEHRGSNGERFVSKYNHLQKIMVAKDQIVEKLDQIGTIGSTGVSTGPHLHVEIHDLNKPWDSKFHQATDPAKYIHLTRENLSMSCEDLRAKELNNSGDGPFTPRGSEI